MFFILILVLGISVLFFRYTNISNPLTKLFLFVSLFSMGLRNKWCYEDTIRYVANYEVVNSIYWHQIPDYFSKDVVFWYIAKFIGTITNGSYTIWLMFISAIFLLSIYYLLIKESSIPAVSVLILISIGIYYFAYTGLRQTIALSMISMSLYFQLAQNSKLAILFALLAGFFHVTAFLYLITFPLSKIYFSKKVVYIYVLLGVLTFLLGSHFSEIINSITVTERFSNYAENASTLNYTGSLLKLFLLSVSCWLIGDKRCEYKYNFLMHLAIIALITQSLSSYIAEMFRLSMYFSLSFIIFFPDSLESYISKNNKLFVPRLLIILFFVYIFISNGSLLNKDYCFYFDTDIPNSLLIY